MTAGFGGQGYVPPDTRVLTDITESPNPGAEDYAAPEKFAAIVQRHDYQLRALASQTKQLQKGVNDATQNPIQQIQQFVADLIVLLGGGELAEGAIDFGDLQYILPVLGALFGIGDGPFPLDLFAAAERLFLGYVVPTKQFTDVINNIIGAWMGLFGIDPKFIKDTKALITAIGQLFGEVGNLLPNLNEFFSALGLAGGSGPAGASLGPLGAVLGPVIKLFSGINLAEFGNAIEFITAAIDPWIVKLTALINFLNEVLAVLAFPGDVVNDPLPQLIVPFKNLIRMLGNVQLGIESFNPIAAVQTWLGQLLLPLGNLSIVQPNLQTNAAFDDSNDLGDTADGKNWTRENLDPPITDGDWEWDLIGRTAAGSATVHANGVDHGLLGNVVYVDEGHTFDFDAYVSWTGLTASTGALALHIQTNDGTNVPIASVASPGASGSWTHLSGSYTVPSGVTSIRLRLYVGGTASAGQVWFDDVNIRRTNLIHQGLIQDLEDDLAQLFGFFQDLLTAAGAGDVVALGGDVSSALSQAGSALSKIGDMLTAAVVSTPAELGAAIVAAANAAGSAGTQIQSIINNSEAADAGAVGTAILTAVTNAGSALSQLGALITNSAEADAGALGSALAGAISSAQSAINQLGDIITNSTQADAAAVGAALAGAATNAANAIGQVADIVNNADAADAAAVGSAVQGAATNAQGVIDSLENAAQGLTSGAGALLSTAQTNFNNLFSMFQNQLQGAAGVFGQADAAAALGAQASSMQSAQAGIVELQNQLLSLTSVGSGGGVNTTIDFSGMADSSTLAAAGFSPGSGPLGITNGYATWQGATGTDLEIYPVPTESDYQVITVVLGPMNDNLSDNTVETVAGGRCNSARDTLVYIDFRSAPAVGGGYTTSLDLSCVVSGTTTLLHVYTGFSPGNGGILKLILGDSSSLSPYVMQVVYNGSVLFTYNDTSHVSQIGSSYRYPMLGSLATSSGKLPASIRSFSYADNAPSSGSTPYSDAPSPGTAGRLYFPSDVGLIMQDDGTEWNHVVGGPLTRFTPPPNTGWSYTTLGSATFTQDKDARLLTIPSASGDNWRIEYEALSPTSNYVYVAYIESSAITAANWNSGIILRDSSSGKFVSLNVNNNASGWYFAAQKWNSPSSISAQYTQSFFPILPNWLRIRDDGTNRYFEFSYNGVDWITLYSVSRTDFITPNQAGWGGSNSTGLLGYVRLRSFEIS